MKQVSSSFYNKKYYENAYGHSVFLGTENCFASNHSTIFTEMTSLIKLNSNDSVVDFGCGNGDLCFYLASEYGCNIVGIDYSKDAIDICQEKMIKVPQYQDRVSFINVDNDYEHKFNNIRAVYLCDVIEHMYDEEIVLMLSKIKKWNKEGRIQIVVHTDNNFYLRLVKPFMDFLDIVLRNKSLKKTVADNKLDRSLHVNLTNPYKLRAKMKKNGFREILLKYPTLDRERLVDSQLGKLRNIPFLSKISLFLVVRLKFLNPSFYAIYEKI